MEAMKMMTVAVAVAVAMAVMTVVMTAAMGGEVYIVGDDAGWTSVRNVDYKEWAATKLFRVGDTIVFQYVNIFHDVARVSYTDYQTCNSSNPYSTFTSGDDHFPIKYPGHYFFICTQSTHCQSGQKVDIRVPFTAAARPITASSPAPVQPLPFPYPQPYVPSPSPVVTPPPEALQAPAPVVDQSPAPSLTRDLPGPSSVVPAPEISPAPEKNRASEVGFGMKKWRVIIMVVWFYLVGFWF